MCEKCVLNLLEQSAKFHGLAREQVVSLYGESNIEGLEKIVEKVVNDVIRSMNENEAMSGIKPVLYFQILGRAMTEVAHNHLQSTLATVETETSAVH